MMIFSWIVAALAPSAMPTAIRHEAEMYLHFCALTGLVGLLLASPTPALAAFEPTEGRIFGNWAVACDNGLACEMTSLIHGETSGSDGYDSAAEISVSRAAGPDGALELTLGFNSFVAEGDVPESKDVYTLFIDGRTLAKGHYGGGGALYKGAEAARIIAALAAGRVLILIDPVGKVAARNALDGSSASLRYIDARQGRAGTITALVAKGRQPAHSVPPAPPLPVLTLTGEVGQPAIPTSEEIGQMRESRDCVSGDDEDPGFSTAALNGGATLVLLNCGRGAYNSSQVPFIITRDAAGRRLALARFDLLGHGTRANGAVILVNSDWDASSLTLTSHMKGRGLGDCGREESWIWDGSRFRLKSARSMIDCRGSFNWLTTWRADVVR